MALVSKVRGKMSYLVFGGFLLGAVVSMIREFAVFKTLFDAWWLDFIVTLAVFFAGVYVMERQIGKICGVIEKELRKLGEVNTKQSEETQ